MIVLHIITKELHVSHAQSGFIFSVPLVILAAIAIPGGALAESIGTRKAAGIGIKVKFHSLLHHETLIDYIEKTAIFYDQIMRNTKNYR